MPLSRALAKWKGRLPEIVLPVLEVGEVAGTMEGSARRLAHAFNQGAALVRKYQGRVSLITPSAARSPRRC
jgi:type II secretory pathway component PulF